MIYAEVQPEIKLKFCIYNVGTLKSNLYDDAVFVTKNSRLLKSKHPLNKGICRNIWQNKNFDVPGFGDRIFKVNRSVTEKNLRAASETIYVEKHSQSFMAKNRRKSALYAEPVEWVLQTRGDNFFGNVLINAKIYNGTIWKSCYKETY